MNSPSHTHGFASPRLAGGVVVAILFMGSTLMTPLYDLYRSFYRLSPLKLTTLYAVYVLGNLAALLWLGRLSDQRGRRPIALIGLGLAAAGGLLFLVADASLWLYAGRVVSGCAVGIGSGAATAWITEAAPKSRRAQAAAVMTAFNFLGLTLGPVLAGVLVQYAPWPLRTPFILYLGLLALAALLVMRSRETVTRPSPARLDLKPRLGVPANARMRFLAPAVAGFIAMAVVGFYAALGPTMIRETVGVTNRALAGAMVAELFAVAAAAIVFTVNLAAGPAMIAGLILTPPGLGALLLAQGARSLPLMLAGGTLCGLAAALGYRGGLAVVNDLAPPERRAETASTYFLCCFLGNALPIVGVGALAEAAGARAADRALGLGLTGLAIVAVGCALVFRQGRNPRGRSAGQARQAGFCEGGSAPHRSGHSAGSRRSL
ncbi:MAG: MFS transporter [Caulobacteraceae bacterium]|nr:MFS transporter [Caulobacteraceae bacterium]